MKKHEKIDYVEFPAKSIEKVKSFFSQVFAWEFVDYGSEYTCFSDQGLNGGFYLSEQSSTTANGATLIVLYSENLEQTQEKIVVAGGEIVRETFSFPGGRRFHFADPNGNEYAVWSDNH